MLLHGVIYSCVGAHAGTTLAPSTSTQTVATPPQPPPVDTVLDAPATVAGAPQAITGESTMVTEAPMAPQQPLQKSPAYPVTPRPPSLLRKEEKRQDAVVPFAPATTVESVVPLTSVEAVDEEFVKVSRSSIAAAAWVILGVVFGIACTAFGVYLRRRFVAPSYTPSQNKRQRIRRPHA